MPSSKTLEAAAKLSMTAGAFRPICLDYYADSKAGKVFLGIKPDGTKCLMKDEEEYTSAIEKCYQPDGDYIVKTKNSIYITASGLKQKRLVVREDDSDSE